MNLKAWMGAAVLVLLASCTQSPEPSRTPQTPQPATAPPAATPGPTPASPQLPPGMPPGLIVKPEGFRGLSFYPGSEDRAPGTTPGPGVPSVRLTSDDVEKVAGFYRLRLGNTVQEARVGKSIVLDGMTPAGGVRVTVEPVERRAQVTIAQK
jgi:hypothetical protein